MAVPKIKSTYSLDPETVQTLEGMARRWGVSKSEALRRAIRNAADTDLLPPDEPLRALDVLQDSLNLNADRARQWVDEVRRERHASSR